MMIERIAMNKNRAKGVVALSELFRLVAPGGRVELFRGSRREIELVSLRARRVREKLRTTQAASTRARRKTCDGLHGFARQSVKGAPGPIPRPRPAISLPLGRHFPRGQVPQPQVTDPRRGSSPSAFVLWIAVRSSSLRKLLASSSLSVSATPVSGYQGQSLP